MQQQEELSSEQRKHAKLVLPLEAYQLAESYRLGKPTAYYRTSKSLFEIALFFFVLASVLFGGDLLLAYVGITSGNIALIVTLTLILLLPLLWPVYLSCKEAFKAIIATSARAYFCQEGLVYVHRERFVVLRWEDIERTDIQYGFVRCCLVMLANGEGVTLINAVGGNLSGQIRRRLMRSRKKHQHPDQPYVPEEMF